MKLKMNFGEFEKYLANTTHKFDGVQYRFHFDNGYGASVVKHNFSYGHENDLWELAVLKRSKGNYHMCYDTYITSDVEGFLDDEDVLNLLTKIQNLPNEKAV